MSSVWRPQAAVERDNQEGTNMVSNRYKHLPLGQQRQLLPIFRYREIILYTLEKYKTLILVGETGSGKSSQLPQYLVEGGWTQNGYSVVCTQPRRVAVLTIAARVAEEYGCRVGEEVGYGMRFDFKCTEKTIIKYYTDGVLLRETMNDPLLSKYSVIIIDEAHHRSMQSDILLGLLKKIQRKRPELRLIVTSATLDAEIMKEFFETNLLTSEDPSLDTAYILSIQGMSPSVNIFYLSSPTRNILQTTVETILHIHEQEDIFGDILVFLPGSEEIHQTMRLLEDAYSAILAQAHSSGGTNNNNHPHYHHNPHRSLPQLYWLPFHSQLPYHQQLQIFEPSSSNSSSASSTFSSYRKVILATNIAETSLTIPNILFVIDSCLVKLPYLDIRSGMEVLLTVPASRSMMRQRAGRAARYMTNNNTSSQGNSNTGTAGLGAGKCYRLLTEASYLDKAAASSYITDYTLPEMQRLDISSMLLQLLALGIQDLVHFDYLSPPNKEQMIYGLELLYSLAAIDDQGKITLLGQETSEMPIDLRLARCLLHATDSSSSSVLTEVAEPTTKGSRMMIPVDCQEEMLSIVSMCAVEYPFQAIPTTSSNREASNNKSTNNTGSTLQERKNRWQKDVESFLVPGSDHLTLLAIYQGYTESSYASSWCDSKSLQPRILQRAKEIRQNLQQVLRRRRQQQQSKANKQPQQQQSYHVSKSMEATNTIMLTLEQSIRQCLVAGYFSHAARLGNDGRYHTLRGAVTVQPHPTSVIHKIGAPPGWVIFHEIQHSMGGDGGAGGAAGRDDPRERDEVESIGYMREVSKIDPLWLADIAPHYYDLKM